MPRKVRPKKKAEEPTAAHADPNADNESGEAASAVDRVRKEFGKKESGAMVSHAATKYQKGARDVIVEKVDISFKGHTVCENAMLALQHGHRYGLVGPNGCGKTTLMRVLGCGELPFPEGLDYYYLDREVEASDTMTPLGCVVASDKEKELLEAELDDLLILGDNLDEEQEQRLEEIYERMTELDMDSAESRAAKILFGLGFSADMQNRPTSSFSGGWRMRISLAQALFQNPTLLLLDEPTNHLDIEAVVWLEGYLAKFKKILLMVSHSQDFMNIVCTNIIMMNRGRLANFDGNYDQYVITRYEKESHQMKRFAWQQTQIKSMKEYIARFGHGHKKLARQAQSKEKTLQKMTRGGLEEAVTADRGVTFYFPSGGYLPPPLLQFTEVSFNYPDRPPLFQDLELGLDSDSRVCLVGPNGAGKTTLTKLICRELEPTKGYVAKNAHCTISRFHQHFADQIDGELTPLEWLRKEFPETITPEPLRAALGRFGISGKNQMSPLNTLSDGQKSRVVFAWMAYRTPHLLILDEPTNHLDIESIDALAEAIDCFEGAVVVVSHDLRLIAQVADEIWIVEHGQAKKFNGDIADYKEYVQKQQVAAEKDFGEERKKQAMKAQDGGASEANKKKKEGIKIVKASSSSSTAAPSAPPKDDAPPPPPPPKPSAAWSDDGATSTTTTTTATTDSAPNASQPAATKPPAQKWVPKHKREEAADDGGF